MSADQVRTVLERLVREGTATSQADGSVHTIFPVATSPQEGDALRKWVVAERAVRTIEIGLGYAVSTLFICEGLLEGGDPNPHHIAIDPHQTTRFASCGLQFLAEAGVSGLVEHLKQESQLVLPALLRQGRSFDVAFVDGNHRFDGVFLDLAYLGRLVRSAGIIALDDYQLPAVERAASFFVTNLGWTLEEVSPPDEHHQWVVLRTSESADTRSFDHFVDF